MTRLLTKKICPLRLARVSCGRDAKPVTRILEVSNSEGGQSGSIWRAVSFPKTQTKALNESPPASTRKFSLPLCEENEPRLRLRPLGQIQNNAYILCEAEDGLYIVSQHRAHERILADKAIAETANRPIESQRLVIPLTVEVGPRALAALEENAALVKTLGFEIEAFGGASVLVRAVPSLVAHRDYEVAFPICWKNSSAATSGAI